MWEHLSTVYVHIDTVLSSWPAIISVCFITGWLARRTVTYFYTETTQSYSILGPVLPPSESFSGRLFMAIQIWRHPRIWSVWTVRTHQTIVEPLFCISVPMLTCPVIPLSRNSRWRPKIGSSFILARVFVFERHLSRLLCFPGRQIECHLLFTPEFILMLHFKMVACE